MTIVAALAALLAGPGPASLVCIETPPVAAARPAIPTVAAERAVAEDDFRELYQSGATYGDFLRDATRRKDLWDGNTAKAEGLDPALVGRARAVGGTWRLLVVAVDACSDSVSTIPYLARLVALVEGLDLRIVDSTAGRAIMEANRTPDGRAATPTVLLLDDRYEARGCFIERPRSLQDWILENDGKLSSSEVFDGKMSWYAEDAGHETVDELVGILEAAAAGRVVCGR